MKTFKLFAVLITLGVLITCNDEEKPETFTVYEDLDGDGFGNPDASLDVTKDKDGYVSNSDDCNDDDASINPDANETPDNEVDENCDGVQMSTWYEDFDADGYGNLAVTQIASSQPPGYVSNSSDCNDMSSDIHPGAIEIKGNNLDEDCDTIIADAICGDGVLDIGEDCDDGNATPGDGCNATCQIETAVCGNGIVESGEGCDDGNTNNGDGCSSTCQVEIGYECAGSPSVCTVPN